MQSVEHWLLAPHSWPPEQVVAERQTPLPSQRPLDWLPPAGHWATQAPSAVPAATAKQTPACPVTLHDRQSVQLADAQQVPSTHWPDVHSPPFAQAWPLALVGTQVLPEQK